MPYITNTEEERLQMLKEIGVGSFDELINSIPENMRFSRNLAIPDGKSEFEVFKLLKDMSVENDTTDNYISFLGGGAYDHLIPSAVSHITSRPEFYTSYTPYQAEVSQGTLQAIYEYQTMICELTGMDAANASLYDGGSAAGEAALLACDVKRNKKILVPQTVNPHYTHTIKTYCYGQGISIEGIPSKNGIVDTEALKELCKNEYAGIVLQHPNFFGCLENVFEIEEIVHSTGGLLIVAVDPVSLGLLQPPSVYNADIVCGEGQSLGNDLNFGGPYLGIFAAKNEFIRKMPGRIIGKTVDVDGKDGYVMVLQTREQHIRREKATSNICTNQQLNVLTACVHLSLLGKNGIKEAANHCIQKSHYLAENIDSLEGYKLKYSSPFFKEFTIETEKESKEIINALHSKKIFAGIDLNKFGIKNSLLIAATEKRTKSEMDFFVEALKSAQ
ncbi:aminomethyl-transferring glycine dehydrogenase subunit GcvPA [candidate division KSB1 bacterium]